MASTAVNIGQTFPSVAPALKSSRLTGLYFAASWCPDCTPVTPRLAELYRLQEEKTLEVVYVSSDETGDEMSESMSAAHGPWMSVPFENGEERAGLKRELGICAGREAGGLGMTETERMGIPALVVIDSATGRVLTKGGVDDLMSEGSDPLKLWESMMAAKGS